MNSVPHGLTWNRRSQVLGEIAEREQELVELGAQGQGGCAAASRMRGEIAEKVGQLRKMDARIQELQRAEDEAGGDY